MPRLDDSFLREILGEEPDAEHRRYFELHRRRYEETLALLERFRPSADSAPPRLLDVGGFPGHLAFAASRLGWQAEIVTESLEGFPPFDAFRRACERRGIAVQTLDIEREFLPFAGERFGAVLFTEALEHLAHNPFHVLGEICRVLRPGGSLILTTPNLADTTRLLALWRQQPIQPPLYAAWSELFPTVPGKRHVREYTGPEVRWLLAEQNKDLYRWDDVAIAFSDCWEHAEAETGGSGRIARAIRRFFPHRRGNIIGTARKPRGLFLIRADACELGEGWFGPDPHVPPRNMPAETPYGLRWMSDRAEMRIPLPSGLRKQSAGRRIRVTLPLRNPIPPDRIPVRSVAMALGESAEGRSHPVAFSPDLTPVSEIFALPAETSCLHLRLTCETFTPDEVWKNGDRRSLGVQLIHSRIRLELE